MKKYLQLDRRLLTILLIVFVQMLGASMVIPILPLYAKNEFLLSEEVITLLGTAFFAAQFIAGPFLGRWSDEYGRVPILILSQIGTVFSFVMLAFAPTAGWLYLARILDGLTGGNIIVAQAYVSDITPKDKQTESFGLVMAAFGVGFMIGPAVGGALSGVFGPRIPYIIASVAAAITVLLSWLILTETVTEEQKSKAIAKHKTNHQFFNFAILKGNRVLITVVSIAFASQFMIGLIQSVMALYAEAILFVDWDSSQVQFGISLIFVAAGGGQLFTQLFVLRWLLQYLQERQIVLFALTMRISSMIGFIILATPFGAMATAVVFALGSGTLLPSMQALATRSVPDEQRGEALGMMQATSSLGIIISSATAGLMYAYMPQLPFVVGGALAAVAFLIALRLPGPAESAVIPHAAD